MPASLVSKQHVVHNDMMNQDSNHDSSTPQSHPRRNAPASEPPVSRNRALSSSAGSNFRSQYYYQLGVRSLISTPSNILALSQAQLRNLCLMQQVVPVTHRGRVLLRILEVPYREEWCAELDEFLLSTQHSVPPHYVDPTLFHQWRKHLATEQSSPTNNPLAQYSSQIIFNLWAEQISNWELSLDAVNYRGWTSRGCYLSKFFDSIPRVQKLPFRKEPRLVTSWFDSWDHIVTSLKTTELPHDYFVYQCFSTMLLRITQKESFLLGDWEEKLAQMVHSLLCMCCLVQPSIFEHMCNLSSNAPSYHSSNFTCLLPSVWSSLPHRSPPQKQTNPLSPHHEAPHSDASLPSSPRSASIGPSATRDNHSAAAKHSPRPQPADSTPHPGPVSSDTLITPMFDSPTFSDHLFIVPKLHPLILNCFLNWFSTLFSSVLSTDTTFRLWYVIFCKSITEFMPCVALSIMSTLREPILSAQSLESLVKLFTEQLPLKESSMGDLTEYAIHLLKQKSSLKETYRSKLLHGEGGTPSAASGSSDAKKDSSADKGRMKAGAASLSAGRGSSDKAKKKSPSARLRASSLFRRSDSGGKHEDGT